MNRSAALTALKHFKAVREQLTHKRWLRLRKINAAIRWCTQRWGAGYILKEIHDSIKDCNTLIDVACGTDDVVIQLNSVFPKFGLVVVNDLDLEALNYLKACHPATPVKFVNADLADLPFGEKFDLAIAKCVLHHAASEPMITDFLAALEKVARRVLIIEIEDPFRSNWRSFFWHVFWYRMLLADDGGRFFRTDEFEGLLQAAYPAAELKFESIAAFKGKYLFCRADFEEEV